MSQNDSQTELYMGDDTGPLDVLDFVAERTANPAIFREGDVVVYNYHNQSLVAHALSEWAAEAEPGVYHVPFQVSGVWAFMQRTLPKPIRDSDVLAYRKSADQYVDYTNWRRVYASTDEAFEGVDGSEVRERMNRIHSSFREVSFDDV